MIWLLTSHCQVCESPSLSLSILLCNVEEVVVIAYVKAFLFELRYQISQECKSELNFWLPQILDCLYSKVLGTLLQFCLKCYLHIIWSEMGEKVILTSINTTFVTNLLLILPTRVLPRMRSRTMANCKNFEAWGIGNTKLLSLCHTTTALS